MVYDRKSLHHYHQQSISLCIAFPLPPRPTENEYSVLYNCLGTKTGLSWCIDLRNTGYVEAEATLPEAEREREEAKFG